jgi:hypothetical protein
MVLCSDKCDVYYSETCSHRSERTAKNKRCGDVICFELFGENCMKIITAGQIFLLN